eukprot:SAG22_NODE_155_length_17123_cov_37.528489_9_plen_167_part_00
MHVLTGYAQPIKTNGFWREPKHNVHTILGKQIPPKNKVRSVEPQGRAEKRAGRGSGTRSRCRNRQADRERERGIEKADIEEEGGARGGSGSGTAKSSSCHWQWNRKEGRARQRDGGGAVAQAAEPSSATERNDQTGHKMRDSWGEQVVPRRPLADMPRAPQPTELG